MLILCVQEFRESLVKDGGVRVHEDERDQYFGLSLREIVHTYKWQTLVLLKCLLLQSKVGAPVQSGNRTATKR